MRYELPISGFAAAVLTLIPLPWHWRARNVPTLSIIAWLFVSNIIVAVNSIIWAGNIDVTARVWCDINTKLQIGASISLPACCLCLCIHLERIASVRQVRTTADQKRRRMFCDLAICWGIPSICMALHYIVQGHRFDIIEDFGCRPAVYVSVAAIFAVYLPILLTVLLTLLFSSAALYHFFRRRLTFARHLQDASSALTPSQYFRLMAMALVQMIWSTTVAVTGMYFTMRGGLRPWISWENVHSNWGHIGVFPSAFIPASEWIPTYFSFWTIPVSGLLFFIFFAFGRDAVKEYKAFFGVLRRVARIPEKKARVPSIPYFARIPKVESQGGSDAKTDIDTATLGSSKPSGYGCDDYPLTPRSFSSFATVVSGAHGEDDRHSMQKAPSLRFASDAADMA